MNWLLIRPYDSAMLAVLILMALYGMWRGMAWQPTSLATLLVSSFVSLKFAEPLAHYFGPREPWNRFIAMLTLFLITSMTLRFLFYQLSGTIDRLRLREFDRQVGAVFGLTKGVLYCVVITFFAVTLSEQTRKAVLESHSGHYISVLLRDAKPILPTKVRAVLGTYIDELQRNLQKKPTAGQGGKAKPPQ